MGIPTHGEDQMAFHLNNDIGIFDIESLSRNIKDKLAEKQLVTAKRLTGITAQELHNSTDLEWDDILELQRALQRMGLSLYRWSPLDEGRILNSLINDSEGSKTEGVSEHPPESENLATGKETGAESILENTSNPQIEPRIQWYKEPSKKEVKNKKGEKADKPVHTTMTKQRSTSRPSPAAEGYNLITSREENTLSPLERRRTYQRRLRLYNLGRTEEIEKEKRASYIPAPVFQRPKKKSKVVTKPGVHWTQLPENRAKMDKMRKNAAKVMKSNPRPKPAKEVPSSNLGDLPPKFRAIVQKAIKEAGIKNRTVTSKLKPQVNEYKFENQAGKWVDVNNDREEMNAGPISRQKDFLTGYALRTVTAELDKLAAQSNGAVTAEELAVGVGKLLLGYKGW